VRSGVLDRRCIPLPTIRARHVHSRDLGLAIGGALALFAWRAPKLEGRAVVRAGEPRNALLLNNVLLTAAAATVFLGTLYPLLLDAVTGTRISVGPPYFAITFAPIFVALLLLVPFGPRLAWRGRSEGALKRSRRDWVPALLPPSRSSPSHAPRSLAAAGAFALAAG
jgi:cytochrome c-type biogenesis protein CcmF